MNAGEKAFQDEKDAKLLEWRNKLASVEAFLDGEKDRIESDDGSDDDLETVAKKRREMEVCVAIYTLFNEDCLKKYKRKTSTSSGSIRRLC